MSDSEQQEDGTDRQPTRVGHIKRDSIDMYVGRADGGDANLLNTPIGDRGWLGNPFTTEQWSRGVAVTNFQRVFVWRLRADPEFRDAVEDLAGRTLGCWCQSLDEDGPTCHGVVIADFADRLARGKSI